MVQSLLIAGSAVFLLLGGLHGLYTLQDLGTPRHFVPRDPALLGAMQHSGIALHRSINLWRAWLGFNLTHSLGILLFGGAFLYLGLFRAPLYAQSAALQACSVLVAAAYCVISVKFFFATPAAGSALALACFVLAAALSWA